MPAEHFDKTTGLRLSTAEYGKSVLHLVHEGGHFTLCGRKATYKMIRSLSAPRCQRCQWEASKRSTDA